MVAHSTITSLELKVRQVFLVLQEFLTAHYPAYTCGGEVTPFLIKETRRTITTQRGRKQVAAVIIIHHLTEITLQAVAIGIGVKTCELDSAIKLIALRIYQSALVTIHKGLVIGSAFMSYESLHIVIAKGLGIAQEL